MKTSSKKSFLSLNKYGQKQSQQCIKRLVRGDSKTTSTRRSSQGKNRSSKKITTPKAKNVEPKQAETNDTSLLANKKSSKEVTIERIKFASYTHKDLLQKLKIKSVQEDKSMYELIEEAIEELVE